jgi:hypothetical protein
MSNEIDRRGEIGGISEDLIVEQISSTVGIAADARLKQIEPIPKKEVL